MLRPPLPVASTIRLASSGGEASLIWICSRLVTLTPTPSLTVTLNPNPGYITSPGDQNKSPTHWSSLTQDEQRLQVTLWSMARSPLFFGGDVTMLHGPDRQARFVLGLLTNREVLAINEASVDNREVLKDGAARVWAAAMLPLQAGTFACAFFNVGNETSLTVSVELEAVLGKHGMATAVDQPCNLVDIWEGQVMGRVRRGENITVGVGTHSSRLLRVQCGGKRPY